MRRIIFLLAASSFLYAQTTPVPSSLQVTRLYNIGNYTIPANIFDNRSTQRLCNYHSFLAAGTGTWSVTMQFQDGGTTGSWTSFGTGAGVTQSSNPAIGYGNGYHDFISFAITGTATVTYSCSKDYFISSSAGTISFPISVAQGGTGATSLTGLLAGNGSSPITSLPSSLVSSTYNFAPQSPGTALSAGSNTVTLTPCPAGVNGTDIAHQLYISAGSGAAEAVTITGGSCTSGAATGTITFTAANSHSGGWTLRSATNGIQEAVQILGTAGTGGNVLVAAGVLTQYGTVTVSSDGITVMGSGSAGNGPIAGGGTGTTGTILQPGVANMALFSVPAGHGFALGGGIGSTVAKLSMCDVGFSNNGLAGITAINLVHDANGLFNNLSFYGTTNPMWGIYADRVTGAKFSKMAASGTVGSFFGSSTDTDPSGETYSVHLQIDGYWYLGTGAPRPSVVIQRCLQCTMTRSNFNDQVASGTGIAIQVLNDSQGVTLNAISAQGYQKGIQLAQNTVGGTQGGPGWTTISEVQLDCAAAASSSSSAGCGWTGGPGAIEIELGQGSYFTSVVNPVITGSVSPSGLLSISGPSPKLALPAARILGGLVQSSAGNAIVINSSDSYPIQALSINDVTAFATTSGMSAVQITGGQIGDFSFTGNTLIGAITGPFTLTSGGGVANGNVTGNFCPGDTNNYCGTTGANGSSLTPPNKVTQVAVANGANQNVAIGNGSIVRLTGPTAAYSIGGFTGGYDGRLLTVYNYSGQPFTINNNDSGSAVANRISTASPSATVKAGASFYYDIALTAWVLISYN